MPDMFLVEGESQLMVGPFIAADTGPAKPTANPFLVSTPGVHAYNFPADATKVAFTSVGAGSSGAGSHVTTDGGVGGGSGGGLSFTMLNTSPLWDGGLVITVPSGGVGVTGATAIAAGGDLIVTNKAGTAIGKAYGGISNTTPGVGNLTAATTAVSGGGSAGSSGAAAVGKTGGKGGKAPGGGLIVSAGGVGGLEGLPGHAGVYGGGGGGAGAKDAVDTKSGSGGNGAYQIQWYT